MNKKEIKIYLTIAFASIFVLALTLIGCGSSTGGDSGISTEDQNKAISKRSLDEIWNTGDLSVANEIIDDNIVYHQPPSPDITGIDAYKQNITESRTGFPDLNFTVVEMIAEGDIVASRITGSGTHKGEFMGIPATNITIAASAISFEHLAGGKVREEWTHVDFLGLLIQLGIVTLPSPPTGLKGLTPDNPKADLITSVRNATSTIEQNKAIAKRFIQELWSEGNMEVADEILDANYVSHIAPFQDVTGIVAFKQMLTDYRTGFSDLSFTSDEVIAEGNSVAIRLTGTGINDGVFLGIPPTNLSVKALGIAFFHISGGKIVETWMNADFLGILIQLGIVPPM